MENNERLTALGELRQQIMEIIMLGLNGTEVDPEQAYDALAQFHRADPKFLSVVHKTLTTGSHTGRKSALSVFSATVKIKRQKGFDYPPAAVETARERLLQMWCCGNLAEETGHPNPDELLQRMMYALTIFNRERAQHHDAAHNESYWYGLAALMSILDPERDADQLVFDGGEFILWAGDRKDLPTIIEVGRERGIVKPEVLEALMLEQSQFAVPLRNGVL